MSDGSARMDASDYITISSVVASALAKDALWKVALITSNGRTRTTVVPTGLSRNGVTVWLHVMSRGRTGTIDISSIGEVTGSGWSHLIGLSNNGGGHVRGTTRGRSGNSGRNDNRSGVDKVGRNSIRETIN